MDALLIFDVLMYINMYYYPMSSVCNSIMTLAKYRSIIDTPEIGRDASVQGALLSSELIKLILFKKLREQREVLAILTAILFTTISICGLVYIFVIQDPILKLEFILDSMMSVLLVGEMFYGILALMPCLKEKEYL